MTKNEAMQMALDALIDLTGWQSLSPFESMLEAKDAIEALRTALAQPEPEPVAWLYVSEDGDFRQLVLEDPENNYWMPLYTAPPQREWAGLTDEERLELAEIDGADKWFWKVCEDIEAKLKEKNT